MRPPLVVRSLTVRTAVVSGLFLLVVAGVLIGWGVAQVHRLVAERSQGQLRSSTRAAAAEVQAFLRQALTQAQQMQHTVALVKSETASISLDRDQVADILVELVKTAQPGVVAIGSVWEPNAFDRHGSRISEQAAQQR